MEPHPHRARIAQSTLRLEKEAGELIFAFAYGYPGRAMVDGYVETL
jgi:hypothetical protein